LRLLLFKGEKTDSQMQQIGFYRFRNNQSLNRFFGAQNYPGSGWKDVKVALMRIVLPSVGSL
jgi:hypothetical protein